MIVPADRHDRSSYEENLTAVRSGIIAASLCLAAWCRSVGCACSGAIAGSLGRGHGGVLVSRVVVYRRVMVCAHESKG